MEKKTRKFHPIIYVRGYAMTRGEIEATVATPYMGFNLGSTKIRQDWEKNTVRHIFESPLIRLMKDYGYQDVYVHGSEKLGELPERSVIIYRYYEAGDRDIGEGKTPSIEEAAKGLSKLILQVREQVCNGDAAAEAAFKVYLVAHSMGGLVCRCFLQNRQIGSDAARALVDKVFTYATPHNGIEMAGLNVPSFLKLHDLDNFNRGRMAKYLGLPEGSKRVDDLAGTFEPDRFFCLVGTNHKDYDAAHGLSRRAAGEMSDGLVAIDNATVRNAPRAFVYRSHSGPYGIVNSESGYQNLSRFLFGDLRVDGVLEVEHLPLPPEVKKALDADKEVRASYYFEATVAPRGSSTYKLSERRIETNSAVLRTYDEMFGSKDAGGPAGGRWPVLFSVFLDSAQVVRGSSVVFTVEVQVSSTGYQIAKRLRPDQDFPGEYLFRDTLIIRGTPSDEGWKAYYSSSDRSWARGGGQRVEHDDAGAYIPLKSRKGFAGKLRLRVRDWA